MVAFPADDGCDPIRGGKSFHLGFTQSRISIDDGRDDPTKITAVVVAPAVLELSLT
jgi:hypothetical protein